jgi:hypothetical protein
MFGLFSNRKKNASISLEEQIHTLKQLGFIFSLVDDKDLIDSLILHFERDIYENDPYGLLLTVCGAELIDEEDRVIRLSSDIWNFDAECVDDEKIYNSLVNQFTQLSKGKFVLKNVESSVDFDDEIAKISFEYNGVKFNWDIIFEDDWVDFDLLRKLGKLASKSDSKQYYYFNDGQHLTLIYSDRETVKKLNCFMKNAYVLLS